MSNQRKLTHLGGVCILRHMDSDFRRFLTKRCPSLQFLENWIPLRIDTLTVSSTKIKIDDITYQMGIIQQYDDHNTPVEIVKENQRGGFREDVDRYGFPIRGGAHDLNLDRRRIERMKLEYETELKRIETEETGMFQRMSVLRMKRLLNEVNSELLPFLLKEQNLDPPFKHYLQLRITSKNHSKKMLERMENRKTLSEATSDLLDYLIAKRRITINNFIVYDLQTASSVQRILENDDAFYSIKNVSLGSLLPDNLFNYKHPLVSFRNYSAFDDSEIINICRDWPENLLREMHLVLESMDRGIVSPLLNHIKQRNPALINEDPDDFYEFVRIPKNAEFELKLYLKPTTKNDKFDFHVEFNKRS